MTDAVPFLRAFAGTLNPGICMRSLNTWAERVEPPAVVATTMVPHVDRTVAEPVAHLRRRPSQSWPPGRTKRRRRARET